MPAARCFQILNTNEHTVLHTTADSALFTAERLYCVQNIANSGQLLANLKLNFEPILDRVKLTMPTYIKYYVMLIVLTSIYRNCADFTEK